jgi:hypothetical protein
MSVEPKDRIKVTKGPHKGSTYLVVSVAKDSVLTILGLRFQNGQYIVVEKAEKGDKIGP